MSANPETPKEPVDKVPLVDKEPPKVAPDQGGIRSLKTSAAFRAVNFELYAKPNKVVMGIGLVAITGCVAYLAYLNAVSENKSAGVYEIYGPDGSVKTTQRRISKWD